LLTGLGITNIRDAKSEFGPCETGIDVVFNMAGRRFGAQHTVYHFDEGQVPGKKRTFSEVCVMSALPPKADVARRHLNVRFVP
jgi:hypothetical protein